MINSPCKVKDCHLGSGVLIYSHVSTTSAPLPCADYMRRRGGLGKTTGALRHALRHDAPFTLAASVTQPSWRKASIILEDEDDIADMD